MSAAPEEEVETTWRKMVGCQKEGRASCYAFPLFLR